MKSRLFALIFLASAAWAQNPQDPKKPEQKVEPGSGKYHPLIDQSKVDSAITKGVEYLKTADSTGSHRDINNCDELILLTLISAGLPDTDPKVQELLKKVLEAKLERTYKVCLQAMVLEEIHRVKYQNRIWQCAQFIVDNQAPNGQWSYGEPTIFVEDIPTSAPQKRDVASAGGVAKPKIFDPSLPPGGKEKPKVTTKRSVQKKRQGNAGDDSNSQYAALGIRACYDAGINFPSEVIALAKKWWHESQHKDDKADGGKGAKGPAAPPGVSTGPGEKPPVLGVPRGWCYQDTYGVCKGGPAYSAMTAGAIGALCIYNYVQGKDWRNDKGVQDGMAWMNEHWSVTEDIGPSEVEGGAATAYLLYYLYALERVGMLYDTKSIGSHDWYLDGARFLLDSQKAGGSWMGSRPEKPTWDTCFAILFLKRATRRLDVATGPAR